MLKLLIHCGFIALFVVTSGCVSSTTDKKAADFPQEQLTSIDPMRSAMLQKRAEDFTQAMVRSFSTGEFSHWKTVLEKESTPGKPLIVEEKRFQQMKQRFEKEWGKLISCHYLGALDQSIMRDYIWKCTFETVDNGNTTRLEELFVVRCTVLRGKAIFTNFGFRFFNRPGFRDVVIKLKKAEVKNEKIN